MHVASGRQEVEAVPATWRGVGTKAMHPASAPSPSLCPGRAVVARTRGAAALRLSLCRQIRRVGVGKQLGLQYLTAALPCTCAELRCVPNKQEVRSSQHLHDKCHIWRRLHRINILACRSCQDISHSLSLSALHEMSRRSCIKAAEEAAAAASKLKSVSYRENLLSAWQRKALGDKNGSRTARSEESLHATKLPKKRFTRALLKKSGAVQSPIERGC